MFLFTHISTPQLSHSLLISFIPAYLFGKNGDFIEIIC
ncbi:hypothetical protein KKC1_19260 [Calderihabitans maritimus]|uniref:Uncharacterized protein n=1 Tax=Calderihabitans maritimus TaxID=1246530 RepID=A0A1Z5HTV9_9FIRM|nr:hypothetical protein KKC1_19260 [Calderihabitans maritimus]